jgi:hypothetical protein
VWSPRTNHLYDVAEQGILGPVGVCLFRALGKAEVIRPSEELIRAIYSSCRKKLFGAYDAELFAELVPDQVLPAIATGQREIRRARPAAPLKPRNEVRILIIRMSAYEKHTRVIGAAAVALAEMLTGWRWRVGTIE